MKRSINNIALLSFSILLMYSGLTFGYPGGVSGRTLKGPSPGCSCHTSSTSSSVSLTISGPATLAPGQTGNYQVVTTYNSTISKGGIDIAASNGTLMNSDSKLQVLNAELTHTSPQNSGTTTLTWNFKYTAPSTTGMQTLYATGCAVFDQWNNASNFSINVTPTTGITDENTVREYALLPNYPNPFNPTTDITYTLKEGGLVTLKVYNSLGEQVAVLVNKNEDAGLHTVKFDAKGMESGVYFYTLHAGNNAVLTKKMILLK